MKRTCKNIDITDIKFIEQAIYDCLKKKKKSRKDIIRLFNEYDTVEELAVELQKEILDRKLILPKVYYKDKFDQSSGKTRHIGIQDIKQQMFDYIAVNALKQGGMMKRVGKHQYSSLPNRGQIKGAHQIHYWLKKDKSIKYFIKLDVKKFYPSVPRDMLMAFLEKHIKNEPLLWLISELIQTGIDSPTGITIGSYLSQYLANLYMSEAYHFIEGLARIRHHRDGTDSRVKLVKRHLFYMDDVLLLGSNKKDLMHATELINEFCLNTLGVDIKESWVLEKLGDVEMMGFRASTDAIILKRPVLKRVRRAFLRYKGNSIALARRIISFAGFVFHSDSYKFSIKYNVYKLKRRARKEISKHDRSLLRQRTADIPEGNCRQQNTCSTMLEW